MYFLFYYNKKFVTNKVVGAEGWTSVMLDSKLSKRSLDAIDCS